MIIRNFLLTFLIGTLTCLNAFSSQLSGGTGFGPLGNGTLTPTPSLSKQTGTYTTSVSVTVTDISTCAKFYYTTNGSTPTISSTIYNSALTFSETTTLKVIAKCSNKKASSVVSATYTITTTVAPPNSIPSSFFGMDVNGLTYGTPWPTIHVGTLRLWDSNTPWYLLNPSTGKYAWTNLDSSVAEAESNGADIIYTFGRTPSWATANGACTGSYAPNGCEEAPIEADWIAFVTAITTHVGPGHIKYWELWNEADLTGEYWNGTNAQLVQMAEDAYKIIKASDPNAIVLSPSETDNYTGSTACTTSNRCGSAWLNAWLAAGGKAYINGVAFHAYPQEQTTPEQVVAQVAAQRAVMTANGVGTLPLLDTESSWGEASNLPSSSDQVAFLARHIILEQSSSVAVSIWYAYDGGEWGALWTKSGGLNAAGEAWGQLASELVGATLVTPCTESSSTYTCTYTKNTAKAIAVWNVNGNATFTVPSGYTVYLTLAGDTVKISGTTVSIGTTPILLLTSSAF